MTYRVEDTALERVFELLAEEGFEGMSQAPEVLPNEMMKVERSRHLRAAPCERSEQRQGYANGFKSNAVAGLGTGVGALPPDAAALQMHAAFREVILGERHFPEDFGAAQSAHRKMNVDQINLWDP